MKIWLILLVISLISFSISATRVRIITRRANISPTHSEDNRIQNAVENSIKKWIKQTENLTANTTEKKAKRKPKTSL